MKMTRMRAAALLALSIAHLQACGERANKGDEPVAASHSEPVVVYAAFEDKTYLPGMLDAYTRETGVPIIVRNGAAAAMVDDVILDSVSPPADLLWTPTVSGLWRAAQEGALRPLQSKSIAGEVPGWLRDPDDYWVSVSYRSAVLVYDPDVFDKSELSDYAALAEPRYRARLCLTSSSHAINQAVIALMIDALAVKPAELVVRGWMVNLAAPVFGNEDALIDAIRSGTCGVGIASSSAVASHRGGETASDIAVHVPANAHANAEGIGIARHARNPAGATALVEWLLMPARQTQHAATMRSHPVSQRAASKQVVQTALIDDSARRNIAVLAWNRDEAIKLAERARYR